MIRGIKRKLKWIGIGVASLFTIIYLIAQFWMNYRLEPFLDGLIKDGVISSSDSLYSISYSKLTFSIPTRTLILKDVELKADNELFVKRKSNAVHVPSGLLNIHLDELKITGIEFFEAWSNRNLEAGRITIEKPVIAFTLYDTIARRDTLMKQPIAFDLYKLFSEEFHSLTVEKILVSGASFRLYKNSTDTGATVSSDGIEVEVNNLKIDSAYSANRYEIDLASKIKIKIAEAHWILPDSIYRIQFSNLKLNAAKQLVSFEQIRVVPLASKYKISKIKGYEDDLIQVDIDSVTLKKLDMNLLLYNHSISCGHLQIENFSLQAFRFKGAPRRVGYRNFPMEQLRAAPLMMHIDSIEIMNGRVEYAEQTTGNSSPGKVFFNHITGTMLNLSNDSVSLKNNPDFTIVADGNLMGKSKLNMELSFDQTSSVDSFTFAGTLGKLELTVFNPLILQTAKVKLEKGTLDAVAFNIAGTNRSASGRMTLRYHDLSLSVLQDETEEHGKMQLGKKHLISFLANTLAIVSENPKNNITRNATLYHKRDTEKYFFNYLWQTLLSGVKETMLTSRMKRAMKKETVASK